METLDDVPEHVLRGLPEDVRLFPSAVDKTRLGECYSCEKKKKDFYSNSHKLELLWKAGALLCWVEMMSGVFV